MSYLKSVVLVLTLFTENCIHAADTATSVKDITSGDIKTSAEESSIDRSKYLKAALDESDEAFNRACPALRKVNANPRFFQMTIPNLDLKSLTSMNPSILFGDLNQKIPPLRLNTNPMELEISKTIEILSKELKTFLGRFQKIKRDLWKKHQVNLDKDTRIQKKEDALSTISENVMYLGESLKDLLALSELILLDLSSLTINKDGNLWWDIRTEVATVNLIGNQIRNLLIGLQKFLAPDYFQNLMKSKPKEKDTNFNEWIKTLIDKSSLDAFSQKTEGDQLLSTSSISILSDSKATRQSREREKIKLEQSSVKELIAIVSNLKKFSKQKLALPTLNAQNLEKQGYIIFKIIGQGIDKKALVRHYNVPLIEDKILDKFSTLEILPFPLNGQSKEISGKLEEYMISTKDQIRRLGEIIENLKSQINGTEKFSLSGNTLSSIEANERSRDRDIGHIETPPSGEVIDVRTTETAQNLSNVLLKLKRAKFKLKTIMRLESLQDMDLSDFPEGFYVLVPPKFGIDFKYPIKDLIKKLVFSAYNLKGTNLLLPWNELPLRKSAGAVQAVAEKAKSVFTRCQSRFGSECGEKKEGFAIFLDSIRYCSFKKVFTCIDQVEKNESEEIHNIIVQYLQDQNSSDLETQNLGLSEVAQKVASGISSVSLQKDINNKQRYQSNLIWLTILMESLKREASFDPIGLQKAEKLNEHLEMILLDAAYRIKLVQENIGASFMSAKAVRTLYRLLNTNTGDLANKSNTYSEKRESKDKTSLLMLIDQITTMKIDAQTLLGSNASIRSISKEQAVVQELRATLTKVLEQQKARKEAKKQVEKEFTVNANSPFMIPGE